MLELGADMQLIHVVRCRDVYTQLGMAHIDGVQGQHEQAGNHGQR